MTLDDLEGLLRTVLKRVRYRSYLFIFSFTFSLLLVDK